MAKRIDFVDAAKGIAICLMVIGHSGYSGYLHQFIYAFHMPFFFLASGLFFKPTNQSGFKQNFIKSFKQLIVPYIAMYIMTIPFGLAFIYFHGGLDLTFSNIAIKPIVGMLCGVDKIQGTCSIFSNGPLWFLLALFCARMLFYCNQLAFNRLGWRGGGNNWRRSFYRFVPITPTIEY